MKKIFYFLLPLFLVTGILMISSGNAIAQTNNPVGQYCTFNTCLLPPVGGSNYLDDDCTLQTELPQSDTGKFAAFGTTNPIVYTEIKGIAVNVPTGPGGADFDIIPDQNYRNLLVAGNIKLNDGDFDLIHFETYGVGGWPSSYRTSPHCGHGPPLVNDNGNIRSLQEQDHISIRGLYVIDYTHYCSASHIHYKGTLVTCDGHAELHPYMYDDVQLVKTLSSNDTNIEEHTIGAPIYSQFYEGNGGGLSKSVDSKGRHYTARHMDALASNWLQGAVGYLDISSMRPDSYAHFVISPPPPYAGGENLCKLDWAKTVIANNTSSGNTQAVETLGSDGLTVDLHASGTDIVNPTVYAAKYSIFWKPETNYQIQLFKNGVTGTYDNFWGYAEDNFTLTLFTNNNIKLWYKIDPPLTETFDRFNKHPLRFDQPNTNPYQLYTGQVFHLNYTLNSSPMMSTGKLIPPSFEAYIIEYYVETPCYTQTIHTTAILIYPHEKLSSDQMNILHKQIQEQINRDTHKIVRIDKMNGPKGPGPVEDQVIPYWVTKTANLLMNGSIDKHTFVSELSYLEKNKVINSQINLNQDVPTGVQTLSSYAKDNVNAWVNGRINDNEFLIAMKNSSPIQISKTLDNNNRFNQTDDD